MITEATSISAAFADCAVSYWLIKMLNKACLSSPHDRVLANSFEMQIVNSPMARDFFFLLGCELLSRLEYSRVHFVSFSRNTWIEGIEERQTIFFYLNNNLKMKYTNNSRAIRESSFVFLYSYPVSSSKRKDM